MKKNLLFTALLGLVLLLQACATVKVSSNKEASYTKSPKKIFILVNCAKEGKLFCSTLSDGLKKEFQTRNIAVEAYVRDPLSLDTDDDIKNKINTYNPEALLRIQQTVTGAGMGTYELTLIDGETKKNVWKSEVVTSTDGYTSDYDLLDKGVKAVVNKLIEDKII